MNHLTVKSVEFREDSRDTKVLLSDGSYLEGVIDISTGIVDAITPPEITITVALKDKPDQKPTTSEDEIIRTVKDARERGVDV